jgi:hypothetical protein
MVDRNVLSLRQWFIDKNYRRCQVSSLTTNCSRKQEAKREKGREVSKYTKFLRTQTSAVVTDIGGENNE